MAERPDYDALAQDIKLKDITSCEHNANILRILRDGNPNWNKKLCIVNDELDFGNISDFVVEEGDDLGWLGYFVGKCEVLEKLYIYYLPEVGDQINRFFDGMSQNQSIKDLYICNDVGADGWSSLGSFLENNRTLLDLDLEDFVIGHESAQNLALALGRMHQNSPLKHLSMHGAAIGDEGMAEIAAALGSQSQLESLQLNDNDLGRDGCIALGNSLSRWPHSNKLETLRIGSNAIDDEGLQALVSGMMNCRSLKQLDLGWNELITAAGLRSLSPLLQSENHSLETLYLYGINFGDDGAVALAEGLRGNTSLKELWLSPETAGITIVGWSAFSKLLCDTSTINNTYLSNHTLTKIGNYGNEGTPQDIKRLLTTNIHQNRQGATFHKILRSHADLDMEPFFEWKMKFLPVAISWLQRAQSRPGHENPYASRETNKKSASRKLSALYKFVRAMPDLAVTGYWEGRVIDIEAKKRMLDDEEAVAWERLGGRPIDDASKRKRMRHE